MKARNIDQDYIDDLITQHDRYKSIGRAREAEKVAAYLLERYDHEIGGESNPEDLDFDPADFDVDEVNDYLADADLDERERVLQAESEGKARKGILSGPHSDLSQS